MDAAPPRALELRPTKAVEPRPVKRRSQPPLRGLSGGKGTKPRRLDRVLRHRYLWHSVVALAVTTVAIVGLAVKDTNLSNRDWLESRNLPWAKPVWSAGIGSTEQVYVHDDLLVHGSLGYPVPEIRVRSLETGDVVTTLSGKFEQAWLSGERLVVRDADDLVVHDLRTGDEERTIAVDDLSAAAVSAGTLLALSVPKSGGARLRAVDVESGEQRWSKNLDADERTWKLHALYSPTAPSTAPNAPLRPETDAPYVLLETQADATTLSMWSRIKALDVATGETRWSDPIADFDFDDPQNQGFTLTASGDVLASLREESATGDGAQFSLVIDQETGATSTYPVPSRMDDTTPYQVLNGDAVVADESRGPALMDSSTRKPLWRGQDEHLIANGGDMVFQAMVGDARAGYPAGLRAIDTDTGSTMWTRYHRTADTVTTVADVVVTHESVIGRDLDKTTVETPARVFDKRTGAGRFQVDGAVLLTYDDEYLVFGDLGSVGQRLRVIPLPD